MGQGPQTFYRDAGEPCRSHIDKDFWVLLEMLLELNALEYLNEDEASLKYLIYFEK